MTSINEDSNNQRKLPHYIRPAIMLLVVGSIILMVLAIPSIFKGYVDKKYCLGSKQRFRFSYIDSYDYVPITNIDIFDIAYITIDDGEGEGIFLTCSRVSETSPDFTIHDVSVGDILYKKINSNSFKILKNGKEYEFLIDQGQKGLDNSELDL